MPITHVAHRNHHEAAKRFLLHRQNAAHDLRRLFGCIRLLTQVDDGWRRRQAFAKYQLAVVTVKRHDLALFAPGIGQHFFITGGGHDVQHGFHVNTGTSKCHGYTSINVLIQVKANC